MATRQFNIGAKVYDFVNNRWGYLALISGKAESAVLDEDDMERIILLTDCKGEKWHSEWETFAEDVLVAEEDKTFEGYDVCQDSQADGLYYCPYLGQYVEGWELDGENEDDDNDCGGGFVN